MAERKPLFINVGANDIFDDEILQSDTVTFGGLTVTTSAGIAMGGFKITNLANGTVNSDAVNLGQLNAAVVGSRAWKEVLLVGQQLFSGATGGVRQSIAAFIATNPTNLDTFVISDGTTTETFTFRTVAAVAFDVLIGGTAAATQTNLIAAIVADSTLWAAVATTGLDDFFVSAPAAQFVVYRKTAAAANDRLYGTLTAPAGIKVAEFNTSGIGDYAVSSSTESNLPAADPAAKRFGFQRVFASLYTNETHLVVDDITTWTWDTDDDIWRQTDASATSAGAGLIRNGAVLDVELDTAAAAQTAGSGGGSSGLEFDTSGAAGKLRAAVNATGGLQRSGTGLSALLNGTTLQTGASGLSVKGLPSLYEINGVAVSANVTAANESALVDGNPVLGLHFHRDTKADVAVNEAIIVGDVVAPSTVADRVLKARADTQAKRLAIGVAETAQPTPGSTARIALSGVATGVIAAATAGDQYFLGATGGLTTTPPASPNFLVRVGFAKNATDLWISIDQSARRAA